MSDYNISKEAMVAYSAEEMYSLVNDLASYPEFVPWCVQGEVVSQTETEMVGRLTFSSLGQRYALETRNTLEPHKAIILHLEKGPLSALEGAWRFQALDDGGCHVSLTLHFQASDAMVARLFSPFFQRVSSGLVTHFVRRADNVYGKT